MFTMKGGDPVAVNVRSKSSGRAVRTAALLALTAAALVLFLSAFSSCAVNGPINDGETYLDGSWYYDGGELRVGYNFFPNGTGYLFIGNTPTPIRYGIYMGNLYLNTDGEISFLPFGVDGDDLLIGNLRFLPVEDPDDAPSVSVAESQPAEEPSSVFPTVFLIVAGVICAVLIVLIIFRYVARRKQSSGR